MPVLLSFGQRTHGNIMFLQPTRDCIGVAPLILSFAIYLGNLHGTELLLDIFLLKPVFILIESLGSKSLAHGLVRLKKEVRVLYTRLYYIF